MFQYAFLYSYARDNGLDPYYQDEYFFEEHKEAIKALYSSGIPERSDKIAIHVRRGTNPHMPSEPAYADNPFYVDLCKTDYYEKAMALFPRQNFLVFSDDIEWCKKQEIFKYCAFYHDSEIKDMNVMASCKSHIIANSSYSWWAAYIAPYTQKVVAPSKEKWYSDGIERTICPVAWVRI